MTEKDRLPLVLRRGLRRTLAACAIAIGVSGACGLDDGDRFGRAGATTGVLRIHVSEPIGDVDPARARRRMDRAIARELFATLLDRNGQPRLARSVTPSADQRTLIVKLDVDARFSDQTPLDADSVVWSWRRALLRSTGTHDLSPFAAIANGRTLAEGRLLRVARPVMGSDAPFTRLGEPPEEAARSELAAGTLVRVVDTNERRPCCGVSVALRREPGAGEALGALQPSEVGTIIGARIVAGQSFLLIRSPAGRSGWAAHDLLAMHVPAASLARVVDRDDGSAALRVGPDEDAPIRQLLVDDAVVELLGEAEGWLHAVDMVSGQMGFIPQRAIEALRGERQWMLVEAAGSAQLQRGSLGLIEPGAGISGEPKEHRRRVPRGTRRGRDAGIAGKTKPGEASTQVIPAVGARPESLRSWVPLRDLAFTPSALGVRALDRETLEIDCEQGVQPVLTALAHATLAPVPAQAIASYGNSWTAPAHIVTSGAFQLAPPRQDRFVLTRSATSFERERARLDRVELLPIADPISALHLYRAGELEVLLTVPAELAPTLARASDFAPGVGHGGIIAPEVSGYSIDSLRLRDVVVTGP